VSGYGLDYRAIEVRSRPALGPTQTPVQRGTGGTFPGAKARPGRDTDHSPSFTAEVENE
jgi:hypothetical protein